MKMITQPKSIKSFLLLASMMLCLNASAEQDTGWQLDTANSSISFISIKKGNIAESHTFNEFKGKIDKGVASIVIQTSSVDTKVDIRNQRMREFLFETGVFPEISVNAEIESALAIMTAGQTKLISLAANLNMHGVSKEISLITRVNKLSDTRIAVSSAQPVLVRAKDYGMLDGVIKLSSLVNNLAIAETVPVSFSLVFESE